MRATEKTLNILLDEVNKIRARTGLCPIFFLKETINLKLQKRYRYQLYAFPREGQHNVKALKTAQSANSLRLYLAGLLDGSRLGMKLARVLDEIQTNGGII